MTEERNEIIPFSGDFTRRDFLRGTIAGLVVSSAFSHLTGLDAYAAPVSNILNSGYLLTQFGVVEDRVMGIAHINSSSQRYLVEGNFVNNGEFQFQTRKLLGSGNHRLAVSPVQADSIAIYVSSEISGKEEESLDISLSTDAGRRFKTITNGQIRARDIHIDSVQFTSDGRFIFSSEEQENIPGHIPRLVGFNDESIKALPRISTQPFVKTELKRIADGKYLGLGDSSIPNGYRRITLDPLSLSLVYSDVRLNIPSTYLSVQTDFLDVSSHRLWVSAGVNGISEELLEVNTSTNQIVKKICLNTNLYPESTQKIWIRSAARDRLTGSGYMVTLNQLPIGIGNNIEYFSAGNAELHENHNLVPKDGVWESDNYIDALSILYRGRERFLMAIVLTPRVNSGNGNDRVLLRRITDGISSRDPWREASLAINENEVVRSNDVTSVNPDKKLQVQPRSYTAVASRRINNRARQITRRKFLNPSK